MKALPRIHPSLSYASQLLPSPRDPTRSPRSIQTTKARPPCARHTRCHQYQRTFAKGAVPLAPNGTNSARNSTVFFFRSSIPPTATQRYEHQTSKPRYELHSRSKALESTRRKHSFAVAAALLILLAFPATASAHGGGLDRFGCHTESATGEYHCHGSGTPNEEFEPRTNSHLVLGGLLTSGLAIGFSSIGIFADIPRSDKVLLVGSGIAAALGSQILLWVLCPIVREESGDDGTDITLAFLGVNSLIIALDVMYLAGTFGDHRYQSSALLQLDGDAFRVGLPSVQVAPNGALAPIFAYTW